MRLTDREFQSSRRARWTLTRAFPSAFLARVPRDQARVAGCDRKPVPTSVDPAPRSDREDSPCGPSSASSLHEVREIPAKGGPKRNRGVRGLRVGAQESFASDLGLFVRLLRRETPQVVQTCFRACVLTDRTLVRIRTAAADVVGRVQAGVGRTVVSRPVESDVRLVGGG